MPFTYTNPYGSNSLDQVTYYLHDHLGNMRVTYTAGCKKDGPNTAPYRELTLEHAADYHPYGSILREWRNGEAEKYLTTHHERDVETGLDYRGARYYDSDVARFLSLDPLAAKYTGWSAYNYVMGNPISFTDPTGRSVWKPDGDGNLVAERGDNAGTLAKHLGISFDDAKQRLADQGYSTNAHGILNLRVGEIFQPGLNCSSSDGPSNCGPRVGMSSVQGPSDNGWRLRAMGSMQSFTATAAGGFTIGSGTIFNVDNQRDVRDFYFYGSANGVDLSYDIQTFQVFSAGDFRIDNIAGKGFSVFGSVGIYGGSVGGDRGGQDLRNCYNGYVMPTEGLSLGLPAGGGLTNTQTVVTPHMKKTGNMYFGAWGLGFK